MLFILQVIRTFTTRQQDKMDGHFWVVDHDNNIFDDTGFYQYHQTKTLWGLEGECIYYEAPLLVQQVMLKKFISKAEDTVKRLGISWCQYGSCDRNAVITKRQLEQENPNKTYRIVFGSMGWKKKDIDEVFWEFGGADWTKVSQFLRK